MDRSRAIAASGAICLLAFLWTGDAVAEEDGRGIPHPDAPAETPVQSLIERLRSTLRNLLDSIPEYEAPEVTEDGDIIIRRKRGSGPSDPPAWPSETAET